MSQHLPECPTPQIAQAGHVVLSHASCICDRLRACEARVSKHAIACRMSEPCSRDLEHDISLDDQRCLCCDAECICGFLRGVQAARDGVAAVSVRKDTSYDMRVQALAAIDALKEDK